MLVGEFNSGLVVNILNDICKSWGRHFKFIESESYPYKIASIQNGVDCSIIMSFGYEPIYTYKRRDPIVRIKFNKINNEWYCIVLNNTSNGKTQIEEELISHIKQRTRDYKIGQLI